MVLASEISLSIAIARLQVSGNSALDGLCRHFDNCWLGKLFSGNVLRQDSPVKCAVDSSRVVGKRMAGGNAGWSEVLQEEAKD